MPMTPSDDPVLNGLRQKDPEALAAFLEANKARLLGYIERSLGVALRRKVEPADIVQEVCLQALRLLPAADFNQSEPLNWLCHLAEQRIIDAHRKLFGAQKRSAHREVALEPGSEHTGEQGLMNLLAASMTSASQAFSRNEKQFRLLAALESLPEESREALRLRYGEGLPSRDIAKRLGKTDGAVPRAPDALAQEAAGAAGDGKLIGIVGCEGSRTRLREAPMSAVWRQFAAWCRRHPLRWRRLAPADRVARRGRLPGLGQLSGPVPTARFKKRWRGARRPRHSSGRTWACARRQAIPCSICWPPAPRAVSTIFPVPKNISMPAQRLLPAETQALRVERALLRLHRGELADSEEFLRTCIASDDPDATEILDALAMALIIDYRLPEAHQCLEALLQRQPDDFDVLVRHAWTAENQAWNTVAVDSLEKALRLRPDADSARFSLVNNLLTLGRYADALAQVTQLRASQPDNPQAYFVEAQCLAGQGRKAEALELLDIVVNAGRANWAVLGERGWLLLELDRPEEAEACLHRAHAQAPPDRTLLTRLADCLRLLGKADEARPLREQAERLQRDTVLALQLTKRYRAEGRGDPELCHELACVLLRLGQEEDAVNFFQKALKAQPRHRPTHEALAAYYTKAGAAQQAEYHRQQLRAGGDSQQKR